jgi:starch synthase
MKLFSTKGVKPSLKILFVSPESAPFAKVGGLGSVTYSLPKALARLGHDARVMMPRYISIPDEKYDLEMVVEHLEVPTGNKDGVGHLICNVKKYKPKLAEDPVTTYFLENQEYYELRANVYGYGDDALRWALLSRGVLEFLRADNRWIPDVIVCADWQTGFIPNYLKTTYKEDPVLSKITTVFAIHNLYYQGMFDHKFVNEMDYDDGHSPIPAFEDQRLTKINVMRRGIMSADAVTTVSPTYAKEILTKEYGELLDELLKERRGVLEGILNGIDYEYWNPKNDPYIQHHYGHTTLETRIKNKQTLQERFNLPVNKNTFVVGIVSRLSKQKGFEMLKDISETLLQELPMQLVVVGEGEGELMTFFKELETKFPDKVAAHLKFDIALPHLVYAGADAVLVPSKFEPSGLTQMEAMRMGCIPIVRKTGGLADSVEDYNPNKQSGTGFVFERFDPSSLMIAFIRAFENFRDKKSWQSLQKRAMEQDFSWDRSAEDYVDFFERAMKFNKRGNSYK